MSPSLLLGPLLRHVDETSAAVWVQTDSPCTVEVLGRTARTFRVRGHHYALVLVSGLAPASSRRYEVRLDGEAVWPPAGSPFPPSRIRTRGARGPLRLVFGSCRYPGRIGAEAPGDLGVDALDAYANRMAQLPESEWADALLFLGDQVYADETTAQTQQWLRSRRDLDRPPGVEVADYDEYVQLYRETWAGAALRWLTSTVPTAMIFDDHDVRDDWNTSQAWREEMARQPWWRERIRGGLASYWVYQHLGNLSPRELAAEATYQQVLAAEGDVWPLLAEFADRADTEADGGKGYRWSFRWDLDRVRLLVIDSRCGRILAGSARSMIGDGEFEWVERNAADDSGDVDHLLVGTSLPWLMPPAISDLQSADEAAATAGSRLAERIRQGVDLEHWPAFRASFDRLSRLLHRVASAPARPATVSVLSGDVHHSYVARARYADPPVTPVHQLTCSPVHNGVPRYLVPVFTASWWAPLRHAARWLARRRGVPAPVAEAVKVAGPFFGNMVATLEADGRAAALALERSARDGALVRVVEVPLSS